MLASVLSLGAGVRDQEEASGWGEEAAGAPGAGGALWEAGVVTSAKHPCSAALGALEREEGEPELPVLGHLPRPSFLATPPHLGSTCQAHGCLSPVSGRNHPNQMQSPN